MLCMQHQVRWCVSPAVPTHPVQLGDSVEGIIGLARHEGLAVRADRHVQLPHTGQNTLSRQVSYDKPRNREGMS
jgi:hypothetical protein